MDKKGFIYFHQGWTDIINCLALINYYCERYNKIYLYPDHTSSSPSTNQSHIGRVLTSRAGSVDIRPWNMGILTMLDYTTDL